MSKAKIVNSIASVAVAMVAIAAVAGAFSADEKAVLNKIRGRISKVEMRATSLEVARQVGEANDIAMAADIETLDANDRILDEGFKGFVAPDGPLAQLNQLILDVDARIPRIALTGIRPLVDCDGTNCIVDVEWFSDPPATGQVEWGTTRSYGNKTGGEARALAYHKQRIGTFPQDGSIRHFRIIATTPEEESTSPATGFSLR